MRFYKYEGAGNDFIIFDNRKEDFPADNLTLIEKLCDRRFGIGADGLMLLQNHPEYDFEMRYFNSDGREASMCGNGGRCIVAFAHRIGVIDKSTRFIAVDGEHDAIVKEDAWIELKMIDVEQVEKGDGFYYMDTGSPHYVKLLPSLDGLDVKYEGQKIRYNDRFKEVGTNVNFVQLENDVLHIYTYERGVEDETLACGTGITAAALSAALETSKTEGYFPIQAKGGKLEVSFKSSGKGFEDIWLKGPATYVFQGDIEIY